MAYGSIVADKITTSDGYTLGGSGAHHLKNRIINGAMVVDQRNAGANTTPANGDYTLDRWKFQLTQSGKVTTQQNKGSVTPPPGFINYLGIASTSAYSVVSSDQFLISQYIEGLNIYDLAWGTSNAKTITVSAWVYSSLTGTFSGVIQNSAADRCYPFAYTISAANTWTQINVTIPGDTTGTWLTTTSTGMRLIFSFGNGSTYAAAAGAWTSQQYTTAATGTTSVVGTSGATFYITGVQLEAGSTATSYDYRHYSVELAMCQRYYYKISESYVAVGWQYNSTNLQVLIQHPVSMRAAPTYSGTSSTNAFVFYRNGTNDQFDSFSLVAGDTRFVSLNNTTDISGTAGQAGVVTVNNSFVSFSAEL
jgi:hypothetical protein